MSVVGQLAAFITAVNSFLDDESVSLVDHFPLTGGVLDGLLLAKDFLELLALWGHLS